MSLWVYLELPYTVDVGREELYQGELTFFDGNITYNLTTMLDIAFQVADKPDGYTVAEQVLFRKGGPRWYELLESKSGGDCIPLVTAAVERMEANPDRYRQYNPSNGWGDYKGALDFLRRFRDACEKAPKAQVRMSK